MTLEQRFSTLAPLTYGARSFLRALSWALLAVQFSSIPGLYLPDSRSTLSLSSCSEVQKGRCRGRDGWCSSGGLLKTCLQTLHLASWKAKSLLLRTTVLRASGQNKQLLLSDQWLEAEALFLNRVFLKHFSAKVTIHTLFEKKLCIPIQPYFCFETMQSVGLKRRCLKVSIS